MRDIDDFFSCSGTLIYIINFQFQPNLRWSNFRLYYCEIQTPKWWRRVSVRVRIHPKPFFMMFINIISYARCWLRNSNFDQITGILLSICLLVKKYDLSYITRKASSVQFFLFRRILFFCSNYLWCLPPCSRKLFLQK